MASLEIGWWVPYVVEFFGTFLFQVFGGSTAVTMDAVFNGVGTHTHTPACAHAVAHGSRYLFCPCSQCSPSSSS